MRVGDCSQRASRPSSCAECPSALMVPARHPERSEGSRLCPPFHKMRNGPLHAVVPSEAPIAQPAILRGVPERVDGSRSSSRAERPSATAVLPAVLCEAKDLCEAFHHVRSSVLSQCERQSSRTWTHYSNANAGGCRNTGSMYDRERTGPRRVVHRAVIPAQASAESYIGALFQHEGQPSRTLEPYSCNSEISRWNNGSMYGFSGPRVGITRTCASNFNSDSYIGAIFQHEIPKLLE